MRFRKDINGLRTIAVIAVVLFHFNANWMPGGFAGVDVFFVISGFLMTGMIFRGIEQENFSILNFYVARANRIIPALAVLCLVLLVFGWFYLTPLDYKILGQHVGSSMGFFSNIIYWTESGYFNAASHEKWLLHTWSLSTEWQFYVIYPLALVAMKNFMSLKSMKMAVLVGTVLGFFFCVLATYKWPNPAYYLLPTRAWEMMIGGVACLYPLKLTENKKKLFEWSGVVLIVLSYVFFSKESLWPGYLALIPVFGAFLLIQAQRDNSVIVGNIVFQNLGKWSYSIYLWHWPLVVAIYYFSLDDGFIYLGVVFSIVLGFLSNKYVERIKFDKDFNSILGYLKCKPLYASLLVGLLGCTVFLNQGYENRNDRAYEAQAYRPEHYEYCFENTKNKSTEYCVFHEDGSYDRATSAGDVSVIVLGDSHASSMVLSVLDSMRRHGDKGDLLFYGHASCLTLNDDINEIAETNGASACNYRNSNILNIVRDNSNDDTKIIISNRFPMYVYGMNEMGYDKPHERIHYMTESRNLNENKGRVFLSYLDLMKEIYDFNDDIYVVYPVPEQRVNVPKVNGKNAMLGRPEYKGVAYVDYERRNKDIVEFLDDIEEVRALKPETVLCDADVCKALDNGRSLYYDDDHLSSYGAKYLSRLFDDIW